MEKEKIINEIKFLKEIIKETKLKCSDDKILEESLKNIRMNKISERNTTEKKEIVMATERQKNFLRNKMGYKRVDDITMEEAKKLIGKYIEKQNNSNKSDY